MIMMTNNIKLYEAYFENKDLLDDMSKRFFDNIDQLRIFIENVEKDPQWARQPIQSVVNLGYDKWISVEQFTDYSSMLKWCLKEYGPLPMFLTQFLKYYQFILNDGHLAYYEEGMASTGYQEVSTNLDIHKDMVETFRDYFIDSDLDIENSEEVFDILTKFKIDVIEDEETDIKTISNVDELSQLDQQFYDVAVEFLSNLEDFFKEYIRDIKETL